MNKIVLLLCISFSATALECRLSNGVEYVKVGNNFQPDGCPNGLSCVNEICSNASKVESTSYEGKPCAVYSQDKRYIVVQLDNSEDHPNKYSGNGCGSLDGKNLTCRGDFGEYLEDECYTANEIKCKKGCPMGETTCDRNNFALGT